VNKKKKGEREKPETEEPEREPEPDEPEALPARSDELPAIDASTLFTGELLRRYREAKGITLKAISSSTRIGVPSLRAVEEDRFEDLPNARIYVRGFVRCLAQELGLDPDQVSKSYVARWERWLDNPKTKSKGIFR